MSDGGERREGIYSRLTSRFASISDSSGCNNNIPISIYTAREIKQNNTQAQKRSKPWTQINGNKKKKGTRPSAFLTATTRATPAYLPEASPSLPSSRYRIMAGKNAASCLSCCRLCGGLVGGRLMGGCAGFILAIPWDFDLHFKVSS
jgi:hypothetical protein